MTNPEDIAALFVKGWNDNDADAIALLFAEDAEFVNVTGLWWHNRESIFKAHRYGLDTIFQNATAKIIRTKVKWLTDTIAVVHAKMALHGQTPIGNVKHPGPRQNIFSFVMQKQSNQWLCVSAHNTDIIAGMETIVRGDDGSTAGVNYRKKPL